MDPVAVTSCAAVGAVGGALVPGLVARIPEPETPGTEPTGAEPTGAKPTGAKPRYADLAAADGLAARCAAAGLVAGGAIGATLGWAWPLLYLLPLVPVGLALAYVDQRTRLLPTWVIRPTYAGLAVLVPLCAALEQDATALARAVVGWPAAGALFWLLWRFSRGMGYGDVRLSGALGIALGYLGWAELVVGVYASFLLGALAWLPLRLLQVTRDRQFAFGPFLLLGALTGVLLGPEIASHLAQGRT